MPFGMEPVKRHYRIGGNATVMADGSGAALGDLDALLVIGASRGIYISDPAFAGDTGAYAAAILALEPVGYWRLGESEGPTAADEMGDRDGTYNGGVTFGETALAGDGTAVALDGTDGEVEVPALALGDGPFTLALWVKFGQATEARYNGLLDNGAFFFHRKPSNHGSFPNQIAFGGNGTTVAAGAAITDTDPHFVVVTYEGGTSARIFIDGIEATTQAASEVIGDGDALHLGWDSGNDAFLNGVLDEVAIFDKVLMPEQIADLYAAESSGGGGVTPPENAVMDGLAYVLEGEDFVVHGN